MDQDAGGPHRSSRCIIYDCNSLVCAVGRRVAADGGVMPGFHHSIAVRLLPFRRCRCHLPLHRNRHSVAIGSNPILPFCRRGTTIVLVTSSLCILKDLSSISVLTRNGNGSYGTEERQRYNGTAVRNGETAERQRNGGNQALVYSSTEVQATCHAVHAAEDTHLILPCGVQSLQSWIPI